MKTATAEITQTITITNLDGSEDVISRIGMRYYIDGLRVSDDACSVMAKAAVKGRLQIVQS